MRRLQLENRTEGKKTPAQPSTKVVRKSFGADLTDGRLSESRRESDNPLPGNLCPQRPVPDYHRHEYA